MNRQNSKGKSILFKVGGKKKTKPAFLHGPRVWKVADCRGSNPQPFASKALHSLHNSLAQQHAKTPIHHAQTNKPNPPTETHPDMPRHPYTTTRQTNPTHLYKHTQTCQDTHTPHPDKQTQPTNRNTPRHAKTPIHHAKTNKPKPSIETYPDMPRHLYTLHQHKHSFVGDVDLRWRRVVKLKGVDAGVLCHPITGHHLLVWAHATKRN